MSKKKLSPGGLAKKQGEASLARWSAAEYLTFVAAGGDPEASVEMRYEHENVWLTQKMKAGLYDVSVPAFTSASRSSSPCCFQRRAREMRPWRGRFPPPRFPCS